MARSSFSLQLIGAQIAVSLSRQCLRSNIDLAAELNVFGIPSFIVYDNGKEIGRFVNKDRKTKQQVEDFLNNLK